MCSLCACLAALRGSVGKFARNDAHSARNSDNGLAASRGVVEREYLLRPRMGTEPVG